MRAIKPRKGAKTQKARGKIDPWEVFYVTLLVIAGLALAGAVIWFARM